MHENSRHYRNKNCVPMLQPGQDVQLCRRSRSQRVADCFACLNGSLFMTRKFEPSGPASRQAGTMWQKSQQWPTHRNYSGSGSSQYLPSVKSQFGTKSSSRLFLVQGKLMGGRARKHLRENSHVQDRTHSSGEDALTFRGVGSRRTCNPVLDSDLTDAGQRPNCTGSGADNGSLCLYD